MKKSLLLLPMFLVFLVVCNRKVEITDSTVDAQTPVTTGTCPDVCPAIPEPVCPEPVVTTSCPDVTFPVAVFSEKQLTYQGKVINCITSNLGGVDCDFMEYHFRTGDINNEFLAWADTVTNATTTP